AKLIHHIHERYPNFGFRQLVETTIQQLEGAFALAFKSRLFPNQLVATRRGSPLLVGIKSASRLSTDHVTVNFSNARNVLSSYCGEESFCDSPTASEVFNMSLASATASPARFDKNVFREGARSIRPFDAAKHFEAEYFFASDASAIIEHTKQVLFLEDDDVAVVDNGLLSIHRIKRHDD
uniref:Glutamine amidotransferase type-2 domain-containing protein n=1 Tax=Panagrolaimus sp. PS1159 TaxID=55785 RepID=A0AC35G8A7_9BILA